MKSAESKIVMAIVIGLLMAIAVNTRPVKQEIDDVTDLHNELVKCREGFPFEE